MDDYQSDDDDYDDDDGAGEKHRHPEQFSVVQRRIIVKKMIEGEEVKKVSICKTDSQHF
jgi:hypothetical protein